LTQKIAAREKVRNAGRLDGGGGLIANLTNGLEDCRRKF
jgi:hypothetical protein